MKKLFVLTAALAASIGFVSCNKTYTPAPDRETGQPVGAFEVKINAFDETKSALEDMKDYQINQVQVFVFDASKHLESYKFVDNLNADTSTSLVLNTLTGEKTVYALVNHSRLNLTPGPAGETLTSFEARLADLSENSATNLVMSGRNTITVTNVNDQGTIGTPQALNIFVKRLAACIQLNAVSVHFEGTSLSNATFTVKEIYLKNVVGKSPVGVTGNTGSAKSGITPIALPDEQRNNTANWYNKGKKEAGSPACIDDVYEQVCTVAGDSTLLKRVLFAYPNKTTADSHESVFSARHTRLVIKAHVEKNADGVNVNKDTYYVLNLPALEANTIYKIENVNITMLGKDDDNNDDDTGVGRINPTITVDPWTGNRKLNYEF